MTGANLPAETFEVTPQPRPPLSVGQSSGNIQANDFGPRRQSDSPIQIFVDGQELGASNSPYVFSNRIDFGQRIIGSKEPTQKSMMILNSSESPVRVFRIQTKKPFYYRASGEASPSLRGLMANSHHDLGPGESLDLNLFYAGSELGNDVSSFYFSYRFKSRLRDSRLEKRGFFRAMLTGQTMTAPKMLLMEKDRVLSSGDQINAGPVTVPETATRQLTLRNEGKGADLVISEIRCENETEFGIAEELPIVVKAGEKANLTIEFKPASRGPTSDRMTIISNAKFDGLFHLAVSMIRIAPELTILEDNQEIEIGHNTDTASSFTPLGGNKFEQGDVTRTFYLRNDGNAPLRIFGIENIQIDAYNKVEVLNAPVSPVTLQPQELYQFELSAQDDSYWLQCGYIEVESNDLNPAYLPGSEIGRKIKRFNVAGAIGRSAELTCGSDSNNFVASGFTCSGKENGTLCGNSNGKSMFCNQEQCLLLGDTNLDGQVNRDDISSFIEDVFGPREKLQADMTCTGIPNSGLLNIRAFADAIAISENDAEYNTRVRANCNLPADLSASRGTALVFLGDPLIEIEPGIYDYRNLSRVCLDDIGVFSSTDGSYLSDNYDAVEDSYVLKGRYTDVIEGYFSPIFARWDGGAENEFEADFMNPTGEPTEALIQNSAANLYYHVTNFRNNFFNAQFIEDLDLDPQIEANLLYAQHRVGGFNGLPSDESLFIYDMREGTGFGGVAIDPLQNAIFMSARTLRFGQEGTFPVSGAFDPGLIVGEYAGLMAFWVSSFNDLWPGDSFCQSDYPTNMTSCLNDAAEYLTAAYYLQDSHVHRTNGFTAREWDERSCDDPDNISSPPCDRGIIIDHSMLYSEAEISAGETEFYPFDYPVPGALQGGNSPTTERPSIFIAGVFYDLAMEAGLGWRKSYLLFWKTMSMLIQAGDTTMSEYGEAIVVAAQTLWPNGPGLGLYDDVIKESLNSRGILIDGATSLLDRLPPAIGVGQTLPSTGSFGFGSRIPDRQLPYDLPAYGYGSRKTFAVTYTAQDSDYEYMAYTTYKHSRYGECDRLDFTDGTWGEEPENFGDYLEDGTYFERLTEKQLGNRTLLIPGNSVNYQLYRKRCSSEEEGMFAIDVSMFGFRVIQEMKNGFSYTVTRVSEDSDSIRYRFDTVDPSVTMIGTSGRTGPAEYRWTFSDPIRGSYVTDELGASIEVDVLKDNPVTIQVERLRGTEPTSENTLIKTDSGNRLDRDEGRAFVSACLDVNGAPLINCE